MVGKSVSFGMLETSALCLLYFADFISSSAAVGRSQTVKLFSESSDSILCSASENHDSGKSALYTEFT